MAEGGKRFESETASDRLSELPGNLIECVLEHLPINDAVRTSILSLRWKHCWKQIGLLEFDEHFVKCLSKGGSVKMEEYCSIVDMVLLLHGGLTRRAILRIPKFGQGEEIVYISPWVACFSRKRIEDLTVNTSVYDLSVPSAVFSCAGLTNLKLVSGVIKQLHEVRGFSWLTSLSLIWVTIPKISVLETVIAKSPLLQRFSVESCGWKDKPVINAPKLWELQVRCGDASELHLKGTENLATVTLQWAVVMQYNFKNNKLD